MNGKIHPGLFVLVVKFIQVFFVLVVKFIKGFLSILTFFYPGASGLRGYCPSLSKEAYHVLDISVDGYSISCCIIYKNYMFKCFGDAPFSRFEPVIPNVWIHISFLFLTNSSNEPPKKTLLLNHF